jgi:hypothetical protein
MATQQVSIDAPVTPSAGEADSLAVLLSADPIVQSRKEKAEQEYTARLERSAAKEAKRGAKCAALKEPTNKIVIPDATSVTGVAQVEGMTCIELDRYICSRYDSAKRLHSAFQRRVSDLLPALVEMERRYKKPGTRTDLKKLNAPTWYDYLKSRGINPGTFRVLRRRAALKQLEAMSSPPASAAQPVKKKKPKQRDGERIEESGAQILAKAGLRLAKVLTNLHLPEPERIKQATRLAEEILEAATTGTSVEIAEPVTIEATATEQEPVMVSVPKCHQRVIFEEAEPEPGDDVKEELAKDFSNATVREIDYETAKPIIEKYEYLRSMGSSRWQFGLYVGEHLAAVECFGATAGTRVAESAVGKEHAHRVCELIRGMRMPWSHPNSGSHTISAACEKMAAKGRNIIVSYGDESGGELGCVLQAANFIYTGKTAAPTLYRAPDGTLCDSRMVSAMCRDRRGHVDGEPMKYSMNRAEMKAILKELGYKAVRGTAKHRYVFLAGSKEMPVKKLRKILRWPSLAFPKRTDVA